MRTLLAALLLAAGCSSAHADQVAAPSSGGARIAIGIAPAKLRAPYDVQVIREGGEQLPTYASRDRFYVQGNAGERYTIRITNPTANRVEAVVSVDGLDVIDGENGDLRKRGYVVPAYGDVRIEGFRTSQSDVATFRFSSVGESYAGRKGKARNVGVIAVAIFEEQAPEPEYNQQIIVGGNGYGGYRPPYDYEDDVADRAPSAPTAKKDMSRRGGETVAKAPEAKQGRAPTASRPAPPPPAEAPAGVGGARPRIESNYDDGDASEEWVAPPVAQRNNRPGLGTEFGESRSSAASLTRFVRAANRPIAIAELRYNDHAGLVALGIHAEPLPDEREIMTRETADPFPGDDDRFARPPGR
jgi:hypothetical protein